MSLSSEERGEEILILDGDPESSKRAKKSIQQQIPQAVITIAESVDEYHQKISQDRFDVVILDFSLSGKHGVELIHELKLCDHEPTVLVVSPSLEPRLVSDAYNAGCHRYLIREGAWTDELGPAVRHLLRIRRLEQENRNLLAKLTEANVLLEEKNRRLDEFSATVAHDIRGPLGGICMKLEYILDQYGKSFEPRVNQLLERGLQATTRLTHVVQAMYDFAKLGSKAARMSEVNLKTLVNEVVADMSFDESIDIKIGIAENLPVVWGNPELLRRAFINLVGNAVKYSDKSEVIINIGMRSVENRSLARFCQVFVQDNGAGVDPGELQSIFTMFSRGARFREGKEGLGIGLSVVQRIVELHFGEVSVESVVGQGSTFVLTLPLERISLGSD